jgi:integrase/recombinase XerD
VKHGRAGGAKGRKGRVVYLGKAARRSMWRYLAEREDAADIDAPLFLGHHSRRLRRDTLRQLLKDLGRRAGVKNCHAHRFRHTFAVTYLRSGGDVFTLQAILGHSTLAMVQHYARLAQLDVEKAHRKASPVDNWHL